MDFVHDALTDGRPFRVLTTIDHGSRQSPVLEVASSMSGRAVGEALDRVLPAAQGLRSITVDHGGEFHVPRPQGLGLSRGVQLDFIRPGKPVENALIESFNGRLRDHRSFAECRRVVKAGQERFQIGCHTSATRKADTNNSNESWRSTDGASRSMAAG